MVGGGAPPYFDSQASNFIAHPASTPPDLYDTISQTPHSTTANTSGPIGKLLLKFLSDLFLKSPLPMTFIEMWLDIFSLVK